MTRDAARSLRSPSPMSSTAGTTPRPVTVALVAVVALGLTLPLEISLDGTPGPASAALRAQTPPRPDEELTEGPWSVDDLLLQESAGDFEVSPDGEAVVWVRSAMDEDEGRTVSNLWITRLPEGESWPLTRGTERDHGPKWSPDGRRIYFLSSRSPDDGEEEASGDQLWALRLDGGEPWAVTKDVRGLRDFAFRGSSSDSVILAAREKESRYEAALEEAEDDTRAVEDTLTEPPVRLWSLEVESGEIERIGTHDDWIEDFAVSPDGETAVVRAGVDLSYGFDGVEPPRSWLVDLETGERTEILPADSIVPGDLTWADDGKGVYFSYRVSSHPVYETASVERVGFWDTEARALRPVDLRWERGLATGLEAVPGGFVALLADGVRFRPARYERSGEGWRRTWLEGEHVPQIFGWSVGPEGRRIAYETSAANRPSQPWAARLEDGRLRDPVRLDELNPGFADRPQPRVDVIRWAGARGDTVEGLLFYPLDWREGRPRPLIVSPHGGPAAADLDAWSQRWAYPTILFNQRGAFVFQPNYHGSAGYGLDWVESIGDGDYYDLEVPDIQAGVDRLIERELVHPDSIAAQGWSNGAILSTALTVEDPERYRAAAIGAGNVEWISDWGTIAFGATFDNYYFGGSPFEIPEVYLEKSPFFRLGEVRTPTIIFHGTEDRAVYTGQGWSHFRALQQRSPAPVRFLLFPGEPHGLGRLAHQRRKVREELRWLDTHLWGREDASNLSLKTGSPLDLALERADAARVDGRFGVRVDGVLVPEVVPHGELEIGRFEVTRAQWAAFDEDYVHAPGTGDVPVSGVAVDEARAYAAWLSERTGETWRLPAVDELRPVAEAAPRGNTLNHWAGYAPNPGDAERLRETAARLSGPAPLMTEAGRFAGHELESGARVYDLGGNAAEWALGPDGEGVAVGRSADRADADEGPPTDPDPAYVGLRVVRER